MELERNLNGVERGLHVVVINRETGKPTAQKIFDTYTSADQFDDFVDASNIPDGHIVIAACKDECTKMMSEKGK